MPELEDISLKDLIRKRLHETFDQHVDEKGNTKRRDSYGNKFTRLDYLLNKAVQTEVEKEMKQFNTNLEKNVKAEVTKHLKENVTSNITNLVLKNIKPLEG